MATIKILNRKRLKKDGTSAVEYSLAHKRETAFVPTGVFVKPEDWIGDEVNLTWVGGKNAKTLNARLASMLNQKRLILATTDGVSRMSMNEVKVLLFEQCGGGKEKHDEESEEKRVPTLVEKMCDYRGVQNRTGYEEIISRSIKEVERYDAAVSIDRVNYEWLMGFDKWLSERCATNTRAIYLRVIRSVIFVALEDEVIVRNPFRKFRIKTEQTKERPMTEDQLKMVWTAELEPWQEEWVAMFRLCFYLIGINMADLSQLTHIDKDGYIRYKRAKTGRDYCIKVEPEAMEIIERYRGCEHMLRCFDRYKDYKQANRHMIHAVKAIGAPLVDNGSSSRGTRNSGPKKKDLAQSPLSDVQQYSTRRTWATVAYNECEIGMDVISLCLGHSDGMGMSVTQRYVKPNQHRIDEANRKVIDYIIGLTSQKD